MRKKPVVITPLIILFLGILIIAGLLGEIRNNLQDSSHHKKTQTPIETTEETKGTEKTEEVEETVVALPITSEEEYINKCTELTYSAFNDFSSNEHLLLGPSYSLQYMNKDVHCIGYIADIEDTNTYYVLEEDDVPISPQHSYRVIILLDNRPKKEPPVTEGALYDIYGTVTDATNNYGNGLYSPTIEVKYLKYKHMITDNEGEISDLYSVIEKKEKKLSEVIAKREYAWSLNSDYAGTTKNVADMESLTEEEFKANCDSMNYHDMMWLDESALGTYVKLHLKVYKHYKDYSPQYKLDSFKEQYTIQEQFLSCELYNELEEKYDNPFPDVLFLKDSPYNSHDFKNGQEIIVYGKIIRLLNHYQTDNYSENYFDILAFYIE